MSECESFETLSAYHDGALNARADARVRAHLKHCPHCSDELARLESLTQSMAPLAMELRISPIEQSRIQARVSKGIARADLHTSLYRVAAAMGLIAASILIISGAWLIELPGRPQPAMAATRAVPEWERIATTLNAQPRSQPAGDSPYFIRYAMSVQQTLQSHMPAEAP